jgi:hypothetical protein
VSTPRPQTLEKKVAELGRACVELLAAARKLQEPYGWAYPYGLQPTVVETAGKTQAGASDPTLAVVESGRKDRVRAKCTEAVRAVDDAINAITRTEDDGLIAIIEAAQTGLRSVLPEPNLEAEKGLLRFDKEAKGSILANDEIKEARAKQARRQSPGIDDEGWRDPTAVGGYGES